MIKIKIISQHLIFIWNIVEDTKYEDYSIKKKFHSFLSFFRISDNQVVMNDH